MIGRILESAAIVVAALLLAPFLLVFIAKLRIRRDFDYAMRHLAQRAVVLARAEHSLELDYSPASIERVEQILGKIGDSHLQKPMSERELSIVSARWGAYIGETMKRLRPGKWRRDSENIGANSMPVVFDSSNEAFPCSWAYKRIVDGPDDNVVFKFQVFSDPRFRENLVGGATTYKI
jgi:hypothetical protein